MRICNTRRYFKIHIYSLCRVYTRHVCNAFTSDKCVSCKYSIGFTALHTAINLNTKIGKIFTTKRERQEQHRTGNELSKNQLWSLIIKPSWNILLENATRNLGIICWVTSNLSRVKRKQHVNYRKQSHACLLFDAKDRKFRPRNVDIHCNFEVFGLLWAKPPRLRTEEHQ